MKKQDKLRTLLYLEYEPDQIFYINGFKKDLIINFLTDGWEPTGLYALWSDFDQIFKKTTAIPESEKFFYPIAVSRWEVSEIFNQITISKKIIKKVKQGQCKILLICPFEGWTWSWWDNLAFILKTKFELDNEHIVFLSANYFPHKTFKTIVFNTWEKQIFSNYSTYEHYERSVKAIETPRSNKFICLNRRPSIHRYAVVSSLFDNRDQGILTCALKGSYSDWYQNWVEENFLNEYPELSDKYKKEIKPSLPLTYNDNINPEVDNPAANEWGNVEKYYSSYLYIVTETFFENKAQGQDTLFLSEKIFKPIIFFQPFVAFARPGTLRLMQDLGYKTFGEFIDETYDLIDDDKERLYKAVDSVKKFISLSNEELRNTMIKMAPIFNHNYNVLKQNWEYKIYDKLKNDLYSCLHGE
jgi:hypothetical protein